MNLSPFVFQQGNKTKNSAGFDCFDEPSPCVLEQLGECVIQQTKDQNIYVPWILCMAKNGESKADAEKCSKQLKIDWTEVSTCQTTRGTEILKQLVKQDAGCQGTPEIQVNGKTVGAKTGPTYENIKAALCAADPTLKNCKKELLMV